MYLNPSCKMAFGNSKPSQRSSATKDLHLLAQPGLQFVEIHYLEFAVNRYPIVRKKLVIFIGSLPFARENKTLKLGNNSDYFILYTARNVRHSN